MSLIFLNKKLITFYLFIFEITKRSLSDWTIIGSQVSIFLLFDYILTSNCNKEKAQKSEIKLKKKWKYVERIKAAQKKKYEYLEELQDSSIWVVKWKLQAKKLKRFFVEKNIPILHRTKKGKKQSEEHTCQHVGEKFARIPILSFLLLY